MSPLSLAKTTFYKSFFKANSIPERSPQQEIAFIGRSNVGKSSLMNHLCQRKNLAKISSTPGKTQCLNFFLVDERLFLVDLPGYGYASVPGAMQRAWGEEINTYLSTRKQLSLLLILLDIRRTPVADDIEMILWAKEKALPCFIILTKADKLSKNKREAQKKAIAKALEEALNGNPFPLLPYSIKEGDGRRQLIQTIESALHNTPNKRSFP